MMPTKQVIALKEALEKRGIKVEAEHWDGHKHVDLCVPDAKLYIEVNGLQHYTDPKQINADILRSHYSDTENFSTISLSNGRYGERIPSPSTQWGRRELGYEQKQGRAAGGAGRGTLARAADEAHR